LNLFHQVKQKIISKEGFNILIFLVLNGTNYNSSCDIFSFGCIMYYLMTGKKKNFCLEIYKDINFFQNLKKEIQKIYSNQRFNLLNKLLYKYPNKRPTAKEIYKELFEFEPFTYFGEKNKEGLPNGYGTIVQFFIK
jgi:serine/threonine protein kinase